MNTTKQPAGVKPAARNWLIRFSHYFVHNWQLYIIFMLPAFALTVIFKYLPMGGY